MNAYRRDLPDAEVYVLDAGHFAFDKAVVEMAGLIRAFADMNATKSLGITPAR